MVKGPKVGCEGRGDLGVRFDKLNELRGEAGKVLEPAVPELVEGSKGRGVPARLRLDLHPLKGKRTGQWSVRVSGNWRIVFRFDNGQAVDVDLTDYH